MATAADVRQQIFDLVYSAVPAERPFAHRINGSVTDVATSVVVDDGTNFAPGDIIEFQDDGEQAYIESISTNTLTVIRGYNSTTAAAHSDNVVLWKNPRFTWQQVDQAVEEILFGLETEGVHAWGTGSVTLVVNDYSYPLTGYTDVIDVVSVYYADIDDGHAVPVPFRFYQQLHTTVSSADLLELPVWGDRVAGEDLYFTYKKRIAATTDLLNRQVRLVVLGAASQLLRRRIIPFTQDPGKRTNRTVQPGQMSRDSREMLAEYVRLVRAEAALLATEARSRTPHSIRTSRATRWVP